MLVGLRPGGQPDTLIEVFRWPFGVRIFVVAMGARVFAVVGVIDVRYICRARGHSNDIRLSMFVDGYSLRPAISTIHHYEYAQMLALGCFCPVTSANN